MNNDLWAEWLEENYKYIMVAMQKTNEERSNTLKIAGVCEKHGVSFKSFLEIITEIENNGLGK